MNWPEKIVEAAARALHAKDEAREQAMYEADRAAYRLGRPKPVPFEEDRDEYIEEALAVLNAIESDVVLKSKLRVEHELKPQRGFGSQFTGRRRRVTDWEE